MPLIQIPDLLLHLSADGPKVQEHPLVRDLVPDFPTSILKFQETGVSEVLGAQLAGFLGLRIPRFIPFWERSSLTFRGSESGEGRIGLLVEYLEGWSDVDRKEASGEPDFLGRFFALCVFDRNEWPEIGKVGKVFFAADLEFVLPSQFADSSAFDFLASTRGLNMYFRGSEAAYLEAQTAAVEFGVLPQFQAALRRLRARIGRTNPFDLAGHPNGSQLSIVAALGLHQRLDVAETLSSIDAT